MNWKTALVVFLVIAEIRRINEVIVFFGEEIRFCFRFGGQAKLRGFSRDDRLLFVALEVVTELVAKVRRRVFPPMDETGTAAENGAVVGRDDHFHVFLRARPQYVQKHRVREPRAYHRPKRRLVRRYLPELFCAVIARDQGMGFITSRRGVELPAYTPGMEAKARAFFNTLSWQDLAENRAGLLHLIDSRRALEDELRREKLPAAR